MPCVMSHYGSDVIVDVLKNHDVEYVACNPGATIRGLYDSIVTDTKKNKIKLILCCHEEIAVALAHGYAKASGKIMPVLLHANIGLLHASMGIFNAWCDRVPLMILGGVGPLAASERRPWIDWIHASQHQGSVVDGFVKWHDQPTTLESTIESLRRGFRLTITAPSAPVYISIDSAIQEQAVKNMPASNTLKPLTSLSLPQITQEQLALLATKLIASDNPLIVVDYVGKTAEAVTYLVKLAECLGIPVLDRHSRFNFPTSHPLYFTDLPSGAFKKIDFIVAIDVPDLSSVLGERKFENIEIAHISLSEFLISSWVADYHKVCEVNYPITAESAVCLKVVLKKCQKLIRTLNKNKIRLRKKYWSTLHYSLKRDVMSTIMAKKNTPLLSVPFVLSEIAKVIKNKNWLLANEANLSVTQWVKKLWDIDKPGKYIGNSGGAGLGYGLGASIGAALACKNTDKFVINLQGDGDFLFTPSALWTAAHYEVPLLIIVINNQRYGNTYQHAIKIAHSRQRSLSVAGEGQQLINPCVDFNALANSFGIKTFSSVITAAHIQPILKKAVGYITKNRKPVLIEIKVDPYEN